MIRLAIAICVAALAAPAQIVVTVARQQTLSGIKPVKRLKLSVYQAVACGTGTVSGGEIVQALVSAGMPIEASELAPLAMMRVRNESVLGIAREAGTYGAGLLSILQASGTIALAGPFAPIPAAAALAMRLIDQRQGQYETMILPLIKELLDPAATLTLGGACQARYVLSGGQARATLRVVIAAPVSPLQSLPSTFPPTGRPTSYVRPPWAVKQIEFTREAS